MNLSEIIKLFAFTIITIIENVYVIISGFIPMLILALYFKVSQIPLTVPMQIILVLIGLGGVSSRIGFIGWLRGNNGRN